MKSCAQKSIITLIFFALKNAREQIAETFSAPLSSIRVKSLRPDVDQPANSTPPDATNGLAPTDRAASCPAVLRGPNRPDLLREESLADILTATARRLPQQPALIWGERVVSYGELDAASGIIGGALAQRGAAPGLIVGLFLPRGADLLIAQAGITKSGAAWLPFDADTPLERIKTCLQYADAVGLVTCREWLPRLQNFPVPVWPVEDLDKKARGQETQSPPPIASRPKPSDPAYVIYTSGSTGQPKGIVISQRGICHFLRAENELLGVRAEDRVYQGFSVAFDMSFEEIWISYLVGATLWIAPPSLVGDPDLLAQTLARERITVLHAVPTLMSLLDDPLPTLRLINLGGEACPAALAQRLARPGRKVFNTYGPTETSVSASLAELKPGEPGHHRPAAAELRPARGGRTAPAVAGRRSRRVVHFRAGAGAGLSGTSGFDGGKICSQSARGKFRAKKQCI